MNADRKVYQLGRPQLLLLFHTRDPGESKARLGIGDRIGPDARKRYKCERRVVWSIMDQHQQKFVPFFWLDPFTLVNTPQTHSKDTLVISSNTTIDSNNEITREEAKKEKGVVLSREVNSICAAAVFVLYERSGILPRLTRDAGIS